MRSLSLTFIFFILTLTSFAQRNENQEIYMEALRQYVIEFDSLLTSNKNYKGDKIIYLEAPDFIKAIPESVNGYRIIELTQENIKQVYKSKNNILTHTKMFPLMIVNGNIKVSIIPFSGSRKRSGKLHFINGGGTDIFFKYDCQNEYFRYDRSRSWGI